MKFSSYVIVFGAPIASRAIAMLLAPPRLVLAGIARVVG
jgi:hypothetical protein